MILNIIIIFFLFLLYIINKNNGITRIFYDEFVKLLSFVALFNYFYICLNIFVYTSLLNSKGKPGPKGIQGIDGKKGNKGICTATSGQQVCNKNVIDSVNNYLESKNIKYVKNKFLLEKIAKICNSDKYIGFLNSGDLNKPIEKDLIIYVEKIVKDWIDIILKHEYGKDFIMKAEYEPFFDKNSPQEIKKNENEGEPYKFKPIIRQQCLINKIYQSVLNLNYYIQIIMI